MPGLRALMADIPQVADTDANRIQRRTDHAGRASGAESCRRVCRPTREVLEHRPAGFSRTRLDQCVAERHQSADRRRQLQRRAQRSNPPIRIRWLAWLQGRSEVSLRSQKPLRLNGDVSVAADRVAIDAMKAEIDGGAVEGRVCGLQSGRRRLPPRGRAEGRTARSRCRGGLCALAGRSASRMAGRSAAVAGDRSRHLRPVRSCARSWSKLGYGPKTVSLDQLKIGEAWRRDAGRRRRFRPRQCDRQAGARLQARPRSARSPR